MLFNILQSPGQTLHLLPRRYQHGAGLSEGLLMCPGLFPQVVLGLFFFFFLLECTFLFFFQGNNRVVAFEQTRDLFISRAQPQGILSLSL